MAVRSSLEFAKEMMVCEDTDCVMTSFYISLFTNVQIKEISSTILQTRFPQQNSEFNDFDRASFSKILDNCVTSNVFLHDEELIIQKDGAPMGGCVSIITFSYVLVSQIGRILDFKRIPHPRYAYDVFILFRSGSRTEPCFQYKGSGHNCVNSTVERQNHRSSYFLEV